MVETESHIVPAKKLGGLPVEEIFNIYGEEYKEPQKVEVLNLYDRESQERAVDMLLSGWPVAAINRGVMGLWLDAGKEGAIDKLVQFKGSERRDMAFGMTIPWETVIEDPFDVNSSWIDLNRVHKGFLSKNKVCVSHDCPELKIPHYMRALYDGDTDSFRRLEHSVHDIPLIQSPRHLRQLFNELFVRLPLRREFVDDFPKQMVSRGADNQYWFQIWDTKWNPPLARMMNMAYNKGGIGPTAVTSFNRSGEAEVADTIQAIQMADERGGIGAVLIDPTYPLSEDHFTDNTLRGSYPGVIVNTKGITIFRRGQIEQTVVENQLNRLGIPVLYGEPRLPNHPVMPMPEEHLIDDMAGYRRQRVQDWMRTDRDFS